MANGKTEPTKVKSLTAKQAKAFDIAQKKKKFLVYYRQCPVLKLAATHVGRDEDTILKWKKVDTDFADQIDQAKTNWALERVKNIKSDEWLLERIMKDHFSPKVEVEHGLTAEVQEALSRQKKLLPQAGY